MHIWTLNRWKKFYNISERRHRTGVRLRFDKNVDTEVRRSVKEFIKWLRSEYFFPIRVPIYVKSAYRIKARDGEMVVGTSFSPFDHRLEPYIRIAVGDYVEMAEQCGRDDALSSILKTIAHELTHYFQWVNDIDLTEMGIERQAKKYSDYILDEYAQTREHP